MTLCALPDCWAPSGDEHPLCDTHRRDESAPPPVRRPVLHCTCPEGTPVRRVLGGGTECGVCHRAVYREVA